MKDEAQQPWEAEVRRVVETHEFEYEPAAWAGMEELLDGAATGSLVQQNPWWVKAWKWLVPTVVVLVVGILWLINPQQPPSLRGSLPIFAEPDTIQREMPEAKPESPTAEPRPGSRKVVSVAPLPTEPIQLLPERQTEMPALLPQRQALPALPPLNTQPVKLIPNDVKRELNIPELDIKRKRNRKALFPDVIKNY